MRTLFISDLHLSETAPWVAEGFRKFLDEQVMPGDRLFILGDFFEVWIGDDAATPFQQQVARWMHACHTDKGVEIALMHGNRDFLIGPDFCSTAGCHLIPDPLVIQVQGQPVLIAHGDAYCTGDRHYQLFRRFIRSRAVFCLYMAMPVNLRRRIADRIRNKSGQMNTRKSGMIMDVTPTAIVSAMEMAGVDLMIHGHTHRPMVHDLALFDGPGQRVVLGDWGTKGWVLSFDEPGAGFSLTHFDLPAAQANH